MAHPTEIAFPLFPHIAKEEQGRGMRQIEVSESRGEGEQCRDACSIVRYSRTEQLASFLANVKGRAGGKHRIDVSAYGNDFGT